MASKTPHETEKESERETHNLQCLILRSTLEQVALRDESAVVKCCVVCLEAVSCACELYPCGHDNFHFECILRWLRQNPLCPLCKGLVNHVLHGAADERKTTLISSGRKRKPTFPMRAARAVAGERLPFSQHSDANHDRRMQHRHLGGVDSQQHDSALASPALTATAISRRRDVYIHHRFSKHVGANRISHFQELTPEMFRYNEELVTRARMWIRRELQVFSFLSLLVNETEPGAVGRSVELRPRTGTDRRRANNAEFLLEYVIAILKTVDIMGSAGQAEEMISEFLGREHTRLFCHELRAWLRSPYSRLEDWDRVVQYDPLESEDDDAAGSSCNRTGQGSGQYASRTEADTYRPRPSSPSRSGESRRH